MPKFKYYWRNEFENFINHPPAWVHNGEETICLLMPYIYHYFKNNLTKSLVTLIIHEQLHIDFDKVCPKDAFDANWGWDINKVCLKMHEDLPTIHKCSYFDYIRWREFPIVKR